MTTKTEKPFLARIHPRNPTRGYFATNYILSGSGYPKFVEGAGWYEIDAETARRMKKILNNPQDPHSRPVFQIVTAEQGQAINEAEQETVATADAPIPMPAVVRERLNKGPGKKASRKAQRSPVKGVETADEEDVEEIEHRAQAASQEAEEFPEDALDDWPDDMAPEALEESEEEPESPDLTTADLKPKTKPAAKKPARRAAKKSPPKKKATKKRTAKKAKA